MSMHEVPMEWGSRECCPGDLPDAQCKSLSDFARVGAQEVQAQHGLRGLSQAHHLKAGVLWLSLGYPLAPFQSLTTPTWTPHLAPPS